jgi:RNA-binding signal recognition particle 68
MSSETGNGGGLSSLGVLKVVSDARNAHGLRLQDPARYNTYCAKRILTLKKGLKFVHRSKKTAPKAVTAELVAQDAR